MRTPRQFVPLLKQMLGFNRYGPWPLLIYFAVCTAVLFVSLPLVPAGWMDAHNRHEFWSGQDAVGFGALWFLLALISTPLGFQLLGGNMSLEFLFTRAIDRAIWLRTERIAVVIIALGPLLLNLLLSPWAPELMLGANIPDVGLHKRYLAAFSGSHEIQGNKSVLHYGEWLINHGTGMFAAWALWLGLVGVFLTAGYFAIVFGAWQRSGWHHSKSRLRPIFGFIMVSAPSYSIIPLFIICGALRISFFEESFLLFAAHPIWMLAALIALIAIVQPLTERGIRKLEFEFF